MTATQMTPVAYDDAYTAIRDAFTDASGAYWLRRAQQLEAAKPRPGDYVGRNADLGEIEARRAALDDAIAACRRRAADPELHRGVFEDAIRDTAVLRDLSGVPPWA